MTERSDLIAAYAAAPALLDAVVAKIPAAMLDEPWQGGWTARQMIFHLADTEAVLYQRFRLALAQDGAPVTPYSVDEWAVQLNYAGFDVHLATNLFRSLRNVNAVLLGSVPEASMDKGIEHPTSGKLTVGRMLEIYAGHAREHMADLHAIADAAAR